jgi:hypothetical protein
MLIGLLILIRVLFVASMVFIVRYVFGSFSKNATLTVITKIATVLVIVLFITANIFAFRFTGGPWRFHRTPYDCRCGCNDSTLNK